MIKCSKCDATLEDGSKFCSSCGTSIEIAKKRYCSSCGTEALGDSKFCKACGKALDAPAQNAVSIQPGSRKFHCPKCKSHNICITTETSVNGAVTTGGGGVGVTTVSNSHRNYWICADCGAKFRNIQNLEEEIERLQKPLNNIILAILGVISMIGGIYLTYYAIDIYADGWSFFAMEFGMFALVCWIMTFVSGAFIYKNIQKFKKLREELEYLKINCFN